MYASVFIYIIYMQCFDIHPWYRISNQSKLNMPQHIKSSIDQNKTCLNDMESSIDKKKTCINDIESSIDQNKT